MIEIVIKIPEELYTGYVNIQLSRGNGKSFVYNLLKAIKEGTPLPKGHGDLKDTEKLKKSFITWSKAVQGSFTDADIASIIYNSPTIIEADDGR